MKCLTREECERWCKELLVPVFTDRIGLFPGEDAFIRMKLSKETGCSFSASNLIFGLFPDRGCLIWVTEWGVWPFSEYRILVSKFRESYGDNRNLFDAPGQLFSKEERNEAEAFFWLILSFGWDAYIIDDEGEVVIFTSHEDYVEVNAKKGQKLQMIADEFRKQEKLFSFEIIK